MHFQWNVADCVCEIPSHHDALTVWKTRIDFVYVCRDPLNIKQLSCEVSRTTASKEEEEEDVVVSIMSWCKYHVPLASNPTTRKRKQELMFSSWQNKQNNAV